MRNDVVKTYRKNFGLHPDFSLTKEMVEKHRALETELVKKILLCAKSSRHKVVKESYDILYKELTWLTFNLDISKNQRALFWKLFRYTKLVGRGKKILEIGCGDGEFIFALAQRGNKCIGTDITAERLWNVLKKVCPNIKWFILDGIKIDIPESEFDVIISSNVIEHFHPDDVLEHFQNVYRLLKNKGMYIFDTPNVLTGPHDIRKIFGEENCLGLHLKEYTYKELTEKLKKTGFKKIRSRFFPFPLPLLERINLQPVNVKFCLEQLLRLLAKRKRIKRFVGRILNVDVIFIIAQK